VNGERVFHSKKALRLITNSFFPHKHALLGDMESSMRQARRALALPDHPAAPPPPNPRRLSAIVAPLKKHPQAVIFALALALRLGWVLTLDSHLTWIDEREFATIAQHLAQGDGYLSSSYRANPMLPSYLQFVFLLFGQHYVVARIGQSLVGAVTCVLMYQLASLLIGPVAALLSGLLLAVYPPHIYLAGVFYVDCLLTFFCALAVCLTVVAQRARRHVELGFLCGVSLGLTALTRPVFLVCVPCVALAWLWAGRQAFRRRLLACSVLLLGCGLTILPWTIRNYRVYRRPVLISSGFYTMLWRGNNELATGGPDDRVFTWHTPAWQERLQRVPEERRRTLEAQFQMVDRLISDREESSGDGSLAMDDVLKPLAIEAVVSHPGRTLVLMLKKVRTLFNAFSDTLTENQDTTRRNRLLAALSFYPVLTLALIGAALGWPRRRELALIYLVIASVIGSYALLTACTRFRLPIDPYLIVFASLALETGWAALTSGVWAARVAQWRGPVVVGKPSVPSAVVTKTGTDSL